MRHGSKQKKFGRTTKQRHALMDSLVRALMEKSRIKTTLAKAKALRPAVEKKAKKQTRIIRLPSRASDSAKMAIIEFI